MANNMSNETQAIVDRLTAEGQLIRNTGTNSIKSVSIKLDKFEGIFNTISNNIAESNDLVRMQLGMATEAQERLRSKEQYDEIDPKKTPAEPEDSDKDTTNETIDKIGDKIERAFSFKGALETMKNMAVIGAGLFVGYNLLKGFVDEKTDGGWSEMEQSIKDTDWAGMKTSISELPGKLNTMFDDVSKMTSDITKSLEGLAPSIETFKTFLDNPVAAFLTGGLEGAIAVGIARGLAGEAGRGLVSLMISHPVIAGIAAGVGALYFIVQGTMDTLDRTRAFLEGGSEQIWMNQQEYLDFQSGALEQYSPDRYAEVTALLEKAAQERIELIKNKMELTDGAYTQGTEYRMYANDISEIEQLLGKRYDYQYRPTDEQDLMQQSLTPDQAALDRIRSEREARELAERMAGYNAQDAADRISTLNNPNTTLGGGMWPPNPIDVPASQIAAAVQETTIQQDLDKLEALIQVQEQSNTERQLQIQQMDQIIDYLDNTDPRTLDAETLERLFESSAVAPVIINAPTIAPSSVNVSNGGSSVNQLSISGGGGGVSQSMLPYGLTGAFN